MNTFAVIIAARDAEKTLTDTLDSITAQRYKLKNLHLVVVDDASEDLTYDLAINYPHRHKFANYQVLSANGEGPSVARNKALDSLGNTTTWTTFIDSDDVISDNYFSCVDSLVNESEQLVSLANAPSAVFCNIVTFDEQRQKITDQHPLRKKFYAGNRYIDLNQTPQAIHASSSTTFFRTEILHEQQCRFNTALSYSEDADFIVQYLLKSSPYIILAAEAHYMYRVNQSASLSRDAWKDPAKYTKPLDVVLSWLEEDVSHPAWLQFQALYELYWFLEADRQVVHPSLSMPEEIRRQCGQRLQRIAACLDDTYVREFQILPWKTDRRMAVIAHSRQATSMNILDSPLSFSPRGGAQLHRISTWSRIKERPQWDTPVDNRFYKRVRHTFFDYLHVYEHIDWCDSSVSPQLCGSDIDTRVHIEHDDKHYSTGEGITLQSGDLTSIHKARRKLGILSRLENKSWLFLLLRGFFSRIENKIRKVFDNKNTETDFILDDDKFDFVIADRYNYAGDNGEHFYRYLQVEGLDDRAVFLLSPDSADWERLASDGFHLLDTKDSVGVIRDAKYLLFSDLSDDVLIQVLRKQPPRLEQMVVFLQHGVMVRNHSRWLNPHRIDLLITSFEEEYDHFIADDTPYTLTKFEVIRTGLARYDYLYSLAQQKKPKDIVLFAPTWWPELRKRIVESENKDGYEQQIIDKLYQSSDMCLAWESLIFRVMQKYKNLKPALFVHPAYPYHIRTYLSDRFSNIRIVAQEELQDMFARTRIVLTDLSSVSLDCAVLGAHIVRYCPKGNDAPPIDDVIVLPKIQYSDIESTIDAMDALLGSYPEHKIADGKACKRIYQAIQNYPNMP